MTNVPSVNGVKIAKDRFRLPEAPRSDRAPVTVGDGVAGIGRRPVRGGAKWNFSNGISATWSCSTSAAS